MMKRTFGIGLTALGLILAAALALSLSAAPTLAQDGGTPTETPEPGMDTDMDAMDATATLTADELIEQGPDLQPTIVGDPDSPDLLVIMNYLESQDTNLLSEDVRYRDVTQAEPLTSREDLQGYLDLFNQAFSNQESTISRVIQAQGTVVVEFDFTAIHSGPYLGVGPTQEEVTIPMVAIYEVENGQITSVNLYYDAATLAAQIGLTMQPAPTATPEPDMTETVTEGDGEMAGEDMTETPTATEMTDMMDVTEEAMDMDMTEEPMMDATEEPMMTSSDITVGQQSVSENSTVTVSYVNSPVQGWVVIHADDSGRPGAVIGYAPVSAGVTSNLPVTIDSNRVTSTLYAMLHQDAGTAGTYEFPGEDTPVLDVNGNVVVSGFMLLPQEDNGS